ncbi:MAG: cation:proton antiporter [Nannocystaceae bacterium]|nr:cation:proton antiporter [Nannocystaceae bacterium]
MAVGEVSPFVQDLAVALGVAAVTSVLCRRLGQPAVLGYLLAGLIVGPYLPVPLFADPARMHALSEFGVVLVMFGIGVHFSPRDLSRALPRAGVVGLVQISLMLWLGLLIGRALGYSTLGAVFLGACLAISSTMVVAKALDDTPLSQPTTELVYGVLVVQDLVAVVLIAALTTAASGAGLGPAELAITTGKLLGFLAVLVVVGSLVVPRLLRMVAAMGHAETLLVVAVGLCFVLAMVAVQAGYSVALGAFVAGSLVAAAGATERIEPLVAPVRDLFAAVFFVSIGMMVDPRLLPSVGPIALAVSAAVVLGQLLAVSLAGFVAGRGLRVALQTGLALGQIGEFSFILAQTAVAKGAADARLVPIVVVAAIVTATTTPIAIRRADAIAARIDRLLPHRVHTVVALWGAWLESLQQAQRGRKVVGVRRFGKLALIDAALLVAIVIGARVAHEPLVGWLLRAGLSRGLASVILGLATAIACAPFLIGMVRCARAIGATLARAALPQPAAGRTDLARAPRRVMVVLLQLAVLGVLTLPVLALTQAALPSWIGAPVLLGGLAVVTVSLWRRADDLDGHVRAGAQVVAELLAHGGVEHAPLEVVRVDTVLPGLGEMLPVRLGEGDPAAGRTLAELDLRGRTGATVLAIEREGGARVVPAGSDRLQAGDVLALVGTHEALAQARALLLAQVPSRDAGSGDAAR